MPSVSLAVIEFVMLAVLKQAPAELRSGSVE